MEKWVDISGISIPSDENDYYELVAFADAIAELEPIYMESIQAEAYNRGIDSERKRIADAWCKAEYERGYKDGQESADRPQGKWIRNRYWSRGVGMGEEYGFFYKCSLCEYEVEDGYTRCNFNYCPHCGARMFAKDINVPNKKGAEDERVR